ncbi:MAG: YqhA family protein [Caldilineaceae bacterium]
MAKYLENCKYIVLIAVVALMIAAAATFVWGGAKTATYLWLLVSNTSDDSLLTLYLLEVVDTFLIGTVLFIFSIGLYDLFIDKLNLPEWLLIDNLSKLKAKLSDVIILFMAVKFLKRLIDAKDAQDTLFFGLAVAVVAGVLILFNRVSTEKG